MDISALVDDFFFFFFFFFQLCTISKLSNEAFFHYLSCASFCPWSSLLASPGLCLAKIARLFGVSSFLLCDVIQHRHVPYPFCRDFWSFFFFFFFFGILSSLINAKSGSTFPSLLFSVVFVVRMQLSAFLICFFCCIPVHCLFLNQKAIGPAGVLGHSTST
ncbi:MAG: hypothetical protein BYD32DRAFT_179413 [Podila humilis]|nr:MAG: hypothetical protein BYD32DRAFT_179413 [Podila humilis]